MKKNRASQQIHRVISTFLQAHYPPSQTQLLITVVKVDLAPDGTNAKVALSFLPIGLDENEAEKTIQRVFQQLLDEKAYLKHQLSLQLGKRLRRIPELSFKRDQSARNVSKVWGLLR